MPYRKEEDMVESAKKTGAPTAAHFPVVRKDLLYSGHNRMVKEYVPYEHQRDLRKSSNNSSAYRHQIEAKPAGYGNFGPQLTPHSVPQQPSLYLYKR